MSLRSRRLFLLAVIQAMDIIGPDYFTTEVPRADLQQTSEIRPHPAKALEAMYSNDLSTSQRLLLALLCSFYNERLGQTLLEHSNIPNFVWAMRRLDDRSLSVFYDLILYYDSW